VVVIPFFPGYRPQFYVEQLMLLENWIVYSGRWKWNKNDSSGDRVKMIVELIQPITTECVSQFVRVAEQLVLALFLKF
jgi:translation elongation factor EF-Tu-like GTPase